MGRAVARIRDNRRCLKQSGDKLLWPTVRMPDQETNTCYWYRSQSWGRTRKQL